jgi:hypothetical protein
MTQGRAINGFDLNPGWAIQGYADNVMQMIDSCGRTAVGDLSHIFQVINHALGSQIAQGQFIVGTGRSHCDGQGSFGHARRNQSQFERRLNRYEIGSLKRLRVTKALDIYLLCRVLTRPCDKTTGEGFGVSFSHLEATRLA